MNLLLVLGNQLFAPSIWQKAVSKDGDFTVFMREDRELCTYYKFHKHKIIFFLAAMRTFAEELKSQKINVHYESLEKTSEKYEESLKKYLKKNKIQKVFIFEIEDKFFEKRILQLLKTEGYEVTTLPSPLFLTSREGFQSYLKGQKKPFMKTFYESQRKNLKILVDKNNKPKGGQWSFDEENRLALPKDILPPPLPQPEITKIIKQVQKTTEDFFKDHPGNVEEFWLPVSRKEAQQWLKTFLAERFEKFGPYEDAMPQHSDFVFHSVLTPFLNVGLLTPKYVVAETLSFAEKNKIPIASLEGFIRQIIGWREFIRGVYQNYSEQQDQLNFWNHHRKLSSAWYSANTGIPHLDRTLKKTLRYGYAHHIERLMILGNLMLLLEVDPREAHRWFMEMFVDSSDWVMGPNIYGMALHSDGGLFATKPYICGSNYWLKMSKDEKDTWCDAIDGLYWGFIEKNKKYFMKNPRLSMMVKTVEKMDPVRKKQIYKAAEELKAVLTK